ncbi:hypothetical protein BaRGS_00002016 [Batillaria attramentaria]|uniref:Uncharacterized protein n=1 Tax=Batillaria attramentaria TaxID=370345 RepID=A0ABD0M4S2_9CAEN
MRTVHQCTKTVSVMAAELTGRKRTAPKRSPALRPRNARTAMSILRFTLARTCEFPASQVGIQVKAAFSKAVSLHKKLQCTKPPLPYAVYGVSHQFPGCGCYVQILLPTQPEGQEGGKEWQGAGG